MYEAYFGLRRRPFSSVAQIKEYFPATAIEAARQNLIRCVQRGEGAGLAIGPSGTGKTLLCQLVAEHFQAQFRVAMLARASLTTRRALLQAVLYELRQPYRGMDEGELRLALVDYLTSKEQCPAGMLLLVDDAHLLPLRVFDEIRALTNVATDGQPRVRLVLTGCGPLEERLASPKLDSFSQRIAARCYLESLNRAQTQEYIHALLCHAGGQAEQVMAAEACEAVHRATDGVPRLVNQLCDHALILAFTARRKPVDAACVEEAWTDLQQLPTPWNAETKNDAPSGSSVVEFGGLDDDEPGEPAAGKAAERSTVPLLRVADADEEPVEAVETATTPVEPLEQLRRIESAISELDGDFQPAGSIGPEVELVFPDAGNPFSEPFEEEEVVVQRYGSAARRAKATTTPNVTTPAQPAAVSASGTGVLSDVRTLPMYTAAAEVPASDEDLVSVDDDYDDVPPPPPVRPVTPVRHLEYRRLFAKLRHG
jgi:type II secretory pathway predicted ATPase ExeA